MVLWQYDEKRGEAMSKFKAQYKKEEETTLVDLKIHNIGHEACDPLHTWTGVREFYSFHTVVEGRGSYRVGGDTFSLTGGDTFLIYPNTLVSYWADKEEPWEYIWLGISGLYVNNIIEHTDFSQECPFIKGDSFSQVSEDLLQSYDRQTSDFSSEMTMLGRTYLYLSQFTTQENKGQRDHSDRYAQKAKDFMELNYSSGITPQQVADKLNISRSHLHRLFTARFGISVGKYINMLQMKRASFLLTTTTLSIGEISNSIGFENQLYFSNVFKKYFQLSPSAFRKGKTS